MEKMTKFWQQFVQIITFINLPIRKKFLLFEVGTLFWFAFIGLITVASLSFIHYRYSQLTQSTLPYMKVVLNITPEFSSMERTIGAVKEFDSSLLTLKNSIMQVKNRLSETMVNNQKTAMNGNVFELFIQSLSKDDTDSIKAIQAIFKEINTLEEVVFAAQKRKNSISVEEIAQVKETLILHVQNAQEITQELSSRVNGLYQDYNYQVNNAIRLAINSVAWVFLIAVVLLFLFTRWLREAFSKPIESIIHQIHSIGTGEIDLSKKLKIKSQDEIGTLSREFNKLVDTVYGVTVFKKVIEEDSSLEVVYSRLGEVFEKEAGIDEYRIFDINPAKQTMDMIYPLSSEVVCNEEILHNCTLCRAQKTGHKVSSFEYEGVCKEFLRQEGKKHVCIPLIVSGHAGAVVQFIFNESESESINEKIFKAESYIKHSLSVIETKRLMNTLRESSLVDGMTGLYNRRFLQDHSNQIIAGALRRKKQISLVMCDMDFFKQVNDKYGHDVGDSVLKETAYILKKCVRESDIVIRFGGEEFLILLIDTDVGYGFNVAEKIRLAVEEFNFKATDGILKKTISLGISDFPHDTDGFWQAIKFADVALYKAKETGRNRCVSFSQELWDQKANF